MSKDRLKNLIKLIAVCALAVILTVAAVVFLVQDNAYAWFAKNNLVSADGMQVAIKVDESVVGSTEYFKFKEKSGNSYTFKKSTSTEMDTYDSSENNDYQIVVKINLTSTTDSVTVNAYTTAKGYLGADEAEELAATGNSMSSVVAFEIYYSDTDSAIIEEDTDTDGVALVKLTPPDPLTDYSFVTEEKTLSSSVSLGETHTLTGTGSKAVYIVIKYNVNAIDEIISHNIGNSVFSGSTDITFDCDFSFSVS
ncbi:MAG: hypothetical protein ACI4MQ_01965 [Candidatus Coproplasma sp.]